VTAPCYAERALAASLAGVRTAWIQEAMEAGGVDRYGRRWYHEPWVGWRVDERPNPFLHPVGRREPWWRRAVRRAARSMRRTA